ncbi:hypothetical protein PCASD_19477 [Puccinia coronata f. sp. avenae]|uniref:Uncharacterized protein n=1 Tax=Puccinia coronata f. sp. avenae TaxID=200324 RepID=A0A2N5UAE6_9BASI|nr:hypothetical protein PCASD_19477 [Puccinia coronata f. sp. avenae]
MNSRQIHHKFNINLTNSDQNKGQLKLWHSLGSAPSSPLVSLCIYTQLDARAAAPPHSQGATPPPLPTPNPSSPPYPVRPTGPQPLPPAPHICPPVNQIPATRTPFNQQHSRDTLPKDTEAVLGTDC